MGRFDGKVAIVTGGASGIGKATMERLSREGAAVVCVDINDELGGSAVKEINAQGGKAAYRHCDVGAFSQVKATVDFAVERFGGLDIIHNNTIWSSGGWVADIGLEDWDGTPTNFSGRVFYPLGSGMDAVHLDSFEHNYTFRTEIPGLRQANGGNVILNSSDGSRKDVTIRPIGIIYIGAGGYSPANYRGFTHGLWMGSSWMDGFTLDITDPNVIKEITYLDELVGELHCGDEVGYGMTEVVVVGKYPKYGYEDF